MLSHDCEVQVEKLIATPAYKEAKSVCLYLSLPSEVFKSSLDCFIFETFSSKLYVRDGICHSRHSRRECKIFASGVNFSRNNAVCYINESKKLHFTLISSQKLLTYY